MPSPRVATCIFCDDVRYELGNKVSLMGIYNGEIIYPVNPPIMVPRLGLVLWLITDVDDIPENISWRVLAPPDRTEIFKVEQDSVPPLQNAEGAVKATFRAVLQLGPITLTESGFLEVAVDSGQGEIRAGRIFVRFAGPLIQTEIPLAENDST